MSAASGKAFLRIACALSVAVFAGGKQVLAQNVPGLVNQSYPQGGSSMPGYGAGMGAGASGVVPGSFPQSGAAAGQPAFAQGFGDSVPGLVPQGGSGSAPAGLVPPGGSMPAPIGGPSYGVPPGMSTPAGLRMAPTFNPAMWGGGNGVLGRVPAGTVISGLLEDEVSSDDSKAGDIFSVRLEDGYSVNGFEVIPKQTKIVGSVVAVVSAKSQHNGSPGKINISLQTIVFPDGRNGKFYGFVDRNPNLHLKNKPGTDVPGKSIPGYTARGITGALNFGLSRIGRSVQVPNIGSEFKIPKGELLPIRLTRSLELNQLAAPVGAPAAFGPALPGQGVPQPENSAMPNQAVAQPHGGAMPTFNQQLPGLVSPNGVPGLVTPPLSGTPATMPPRAVPGMANPPAASVQPQSLPDPF